MLGDFKGVGHFEAKFSVQGLRFAPISMDRGEMVISQLCRWNFHTKNFVADFIPLKLNFIQTKKSLFELPIRGLRGNVRTCWKVRGRLPVRGGTGTPTTTRFLHYIALPGIIWTWPSITFYKHQIRRIVIVTIFATFSYTHTRVSVRIFIAVRCLLSVMTSESKNSQ